MHRKDRGASDALVVVGVLVALIVVIVGAWLLSLALADPVGRGEAYKQKESANNRVFAQQRFQQLAEEYDATLVRIDQAAAVRSTSPEAETRFQGLQAYCAQVVAAYNTAAKSYTTKDFRDADLLDHLDASRCTATPKEPTP